MKRAEREGGSGTGEKKHAKKGRKQSNSRPPWCLPELDNKGEKLNGSTPPPKKEEKQLEPAAKPTPEPTAKPTPELAPIPALLPTPQPTVGGSCMHPLTRSKSNGHIAGEASAKGPGKKEERRFKVVEHLDLMSNSSSDDMDLNSDHEGRLVQSRGGEHLDPSGPVEPPAARRDEGGVTLGAGGPGTQLHWELDEYERRSRLSQEETDRREEVIRIVTNAALKVCPRCEVMCFGSTANGLDTPSSDIDLVMIGVFEPNAPHGGFAEPIKGEVSNLLSRVMRELRNTLDLKNSFIIRKARIPLVKLTTTDSLDVDVSIGDEHGPQAAELLRAKVKSYPPLRPLCLALKSLIKDKGLNEVVSGGLGTYALSNMIIAHLMELQRKGDFETDYGSLFVSFLKRFGYCFDYVSQAVSIGRGGIVDKRIVVEAGVVNASNYDGSQGKRHNDTPTWERLLVEDYFTGRDVSSGTFKLHQISRLFASTFINLKDRFCVPPLPPDSPELSTLSTLFKVKGVGKKESLPRVDTHVGGKRKFEDNEPKPKQKSKKKKKNKGGAQGQADEKPSQQQKKTAPVKTDREAFVAKIKAILKKKF